MAWSKGAVDVTTGRGGRVTVTVGVARTVVGVTTVVVAVTVVVSVRHSGTVTVAVGASVVPGGA